MLKLHLALFLILLVNSGVTALWCWQCEGPSCGDPGDPDDPDNVGWKKVECTGSCVYEPGRPKRPKPGPGSWIHAKYYCSPERMITTSDWGLCEYSSHMVRFFSTLLGWC